MSTSPTQQAVVGARVAVAAQQLGIDVQSMLEQLFQAASGFDGVVVLTDADVRTFSVAIDLGDDQLLASRMAALAAGISGSKALSRAAMARPGLRQVERGIGANGPTGEEMSGVFAALSVVGPATLDEDLAAATAIGMDPDAATALGNRLLQLTGDGGAHPRLVRTTIYSGSPGRDSMIELACEAPPDLLARLSRPGPGLDIGAAQLRLLANIHPILAANAAVWVRCGTGPGVTLVYRDVSLDACQHVVHGLATRGEAMARWGTLVGALGARRAPWLELSLGPIDPVPARLGLSVTV